MTLYVSRIAGGATLQDAGRPGFRRFGVPPGGAFDRVGVEVANAILGNRLDAPILELPAWGAEFVAEAAISLGIAGAETEVRKNGSLVACAGVVNLEIGDRLTIGPFLVGARVSIAAPGGWRDSAVLGSVSGRPIGPGSRISANGGPLVASRSLSPLASKGMVALYVPSAEFDDLFHARIGATHFRVGLHSNRAGVRLEGFPEAHRLERLSEPMDVGSIQWTPGGELIVIGPDGPTIGGYPRIGTVLRQHLPLMAQMGTAQSARLAPIRAELAESIEREMSERHVALIERVTPG